MLGLGGVARPRARTLRGGVVGPTWAFLPMKPVWARPTIEGMTRNDGNDADGSRWPCSGAPPSRGRSVQDEEEDEDNIVRGENGWPVTTIGLVMEDVRARG